MTPKFLPALLLYAALAASPAFAAEWFTIIGNEADPAVDTIQVDPTPVAVKGHMRLLNVRVSRARQRTTKDGIKFRSFVAVTEFDCDKLTARFTKTRFYNEPLWTSPGRDMDFPATDVRQMAFREINPNPTERVIKAACVTTGAPAR